jgi:histidinol-phosphate phosphatase family protein
VTYDVVVPTIGRPSLAVLLDALARSAGPPPRAVVLVDDRRRPSTPLVASVPPALVPLVRVLRGRAAGPAAARNTGWRASSAPWIAFLDDDVVPAPDWCARLAEDLDALAPDIAGCQGTIRVPRPPGRPPTDWERNVRGLERARWATADMAYRREALERAGGFDERFRRAYREDADLALRLAGAGYALVHGRRVVEHPVRPAGVWTSVRLQAGNADDALMAALHGRGWRSRAGAPRGRRRSHLVTTAALALAAGALLRGRRGVAAGGLAVWLARTASFAWSRIAPGPRTAREVVTMAVTSAVIPLAAVFHYTTGLLALPWRLGPSRSGPAPSPPAIREARLGTDAAAHGDDAHAGRPIAPRAVLLDRDGTLIVDVPYNGDPARVVPVPGARAALDRLRAHGVALAVVTNQSGVARGLIRPEQVDAVNRRVEALLGPLGPWLVCMHGEADRCACRKPAPGLVLAAAAALGVPAEACAVVGDTGADVQAALAAGARPILVPTAVTRAAEIERAPEVAPDLATAVARLLGSRSPAGAEVVA